MLAMGVDFSRQHEVMRDLRSPWRFGSGLDVEQFKQVSRFDDRASLAHSLVLVTSAVTAGVGIVALAKFVARGDVGSVLTAMLASILVAVGRVVLIRGYRSTRHELGLTRTGVIVRAIQQERTARTWRGALARAEGSSLGVLTLLLVPLVIVLPAEAVVDPTMLWRRLLLQVTALLMVCAAAFLYVELIPSGARWRRAATLSITALMILMYGLTAFLCAARTFYWFNWPGLVWGTVAAVVSLALTLVSVLPGAPGGGALVSFAAAHIPRYRRLVASPARVEPFFLLVPRGEGPS